MITDHDLYSLLIAADIIGGSPPAVRADASLSEALAVFAAHEVYNLPVVDDIEHSQLLGVITRTRLMSRYHQELQRRVEA